jgi:hypothetical protein
MNKLLRYGWMLGFSALGCGAAPVSDGSTRAGDEMPNEDPANGGESTALRAAALCTRRYR